MSFWGIVAPEARTNLVCNPSAETTGNYAPIGATVSHAYDQARFGIKSYKVVTGGTSQGVFCFMTTASNTTHYASWYAWAVTGTMRCSANSGTNWNTASVIGGKTGGWVRHGAVLPPAETSQSPYLAIIDTANDGTIYIDGVQCEAGSYPTTYIDGDMEGLYRWNGLRHASSSTRDAQERSGGREADLSDVYNITVQPTFSGVGMPQIKNNLQSMSLQPGALLQSQKILPREITLDLNINTQSTATWPSLHQNRQALINLVKPDATRGAQPFTLVYNGADNGAGRKPLYAKFVYAGGLGFGNIQNGFLDMPQLRCLAVDPAWYEDNQETKNISLNQSINWEGAIRRINGNYDNLTTQAFGAPAEANVYCMTIDQQRRRVYFGFDGTTAGDVAVGFITYWDGYKFSAMGGTTVGLNAHPDKMTVAPNGDVWIVGGFTSAAGSPSNGVTRYNVSNNSFTAFNVASSAGNWKTVSVNYDGIIYLGGSVTNWGAASTQSYVTKYENATWGQVGTAPFVSTDYPYSMSIDANNNLLVGTSAAGNTAKLYKWTGASWTTLAQTDSGTKRLNDILITPDNNYIVGGTFVSLGGCIVNNIGQYNGSVVSGLGTGVNSEVYGLDRSDDGLLTCIGSFSTAGTITLESSIASWNGYTWNYHDSNPPITYILRAINYLGDDVYIAGEYASGVATAMFSSKQTSVVPNATASLYPRFFLVSNSTAATFGLRWIENQTTKERLYWTYNIQGGEMLAVDFSVSNKTVVSDWRGSIYGQPASGSDFANFHLLPTTNTICVFIPDATTTSGVTALMQWTPAHHSVDGAA